MGDEQVEPSAYYTGLVAQLYRHLRSESFDPEPYARFVERSGQPALELGCGDGDPILALRARGLEVEGLDSSADMLQRCRVAADALGLDVVLHHATFESMDLRRQYRSIYLAGATFNLLPDDRAAQAALHRIAAHLAPGGAALIPLFVPGPETVGGVGRPRQHVAADGTIMRFTVLSIERDEQGRTLTSRQRYERIDDVDVQTVERAWILHWFDRAQFAVMASEAGLRVSAVFADDGSRAGPDPTSFTCLLTLDDEASDSAS